MNALLWKDYRVNRTVVILGLALLFGPLVAAVAIKLVEQMRYGEPIYWFDVMAKVGAVTLGLSLLTLAFLGGNAFAGERADRSAEFMAYLPPTRARKLASKVIFALGSAVVVVGVTLLIGYCLAPALGDPSEDMVQFRRVTSSVMLPTAAFIFGAAWCASSFLSSPTYAVGIGFALPWLLFLALALVEYWVEIEDFDFGLWYIMIAVLLAMLAFLAGCGIYLKRVEP